MASPGRTTRARRRLPLLLALGLLVSCALVTGCSSDSPSMLDHHGSEAQRIAGIWWIMFGLAAGVYVVVGGLVVAAVMRRPPGPPGRDDGEDGDEGEEVDPPDAEDLEDPDDLVADTPASERLDGRWIWIGGVAVPVLILAVIAVLTVSSTRDLRAAEDGELVVEVRGERWWWDVRYAESGVRTANEIHLPVGRPIDLVLTSDNVIHSFWVPQLAGKVDLIPGQPNHLRFQIDDPGTYRGVCAEYCGIGHARMDVVVVAQEAEDFGRWQARREQPAPGPTDELEAQGQRIFLSAPCAGCHRIKGTPANAEIGPDLSDFGSRDWIGAITVENTPQNLADWIVNSHTIKPGSLMPPQPVGGDQVQALVAYLGGLR